MSRKDAQLDAMLRHLGAAYYDSLHGRAANADVTRAVAQVANELAEPAGEDGTRTRQGVHGRLHSRVQDVMTTAVVCVDRITGYKEIASLLAEHHVGGVPVLELGRRVAGIVTEADLVAAASRPAVSGPGSWRPRPLRRDQGLTAGHLMTSPAVSTHPDAPLAQVARAMTDHRIGRLPVVTADGVLIGIVSRRDLLKVFLRPDDDIARQIAELLADLLPANPEVKAAVNDGVVTLAYQPGQVGRAELQHLVTLARDVDGVVEVRAAG